MKNESNANKTFARTEREKLRELFTARASSAPIPDPFDAKSIQEWEEYCKEMRGMEATLRDAGEVL